MFYICGRKPKKYYIIIDWYVYGRGMVDIFYIHVGSRIFLTMIIYFQLCIACASMLLTVSTLTYAILMFNRDSKIFSSPLNCTCFISIRIALTVLAVSDRDSW